MGMIIPVPPHRLLEGLNNTMQVRGSAWIVAMLLKNHLFIGGGGVVIVL